MMQQRFQYRNSRGEEVGWIENGIYHSRRNFLKGQIFRKPCFGNGIAVDKAILVDLWNKGIRQVRILVEKFERHSFWLQADIQTFFYDGIKVNYDLRRFGPVSSRYGEQIILPMNQWTKLDPGQTNMEAFK